MPTYDYECDACGHRFELFQSISADPEKKCPECKKLKLRRLIGTGAAVVFKGSGFYQTDYRSDSYKKSAAADSSPSSSSSEKASSETSSSEKSTSDKSTNKSAGGSSSSSEKKTKKKD
ncbi:MAG: zinc ribbon domain-containing protein [Planctomycetaceae bacterium]|jgi:putative FmdB family regulatory protein|nr:zinc ribbon domain-containing protein [Planctomycetaceae bacterium]